MAKDDLKPEYDFSRLGNSIRDKYAEAYKMTQFAFIGPKPDLFQLEIEGERIRLISITEAFAEDIFTEFSSDITTYMTPKPADSIEETKAFVRSSLAAFGEGDNLQLVILDKTTGAFLGCCGLHGRDDVKNPEIGIWLKKSAHGKALGKEAVWTLVYWAQDHMHIDSFIYPVDKRNQPSRNIPISLGGQVIEEKVDKGMAGNVLDEVVYRISLPLPIS